MTVYAKVGLYRGILTPMHWHEPYEYWQWPWEQHRKRGGDHALHDVANPVWVHSSCTDPRKQFIPYLPTPSEAAWYAACLAKPDQKVVESFHALQSKSSSP